MPFSELAASTLNALLRVKLEAQDCQIGHFRYEVVDSQPQLALQGHRADRLAPLYFTNWEPALQRALEAYLAASRPRPALLTIDINLLRDEFTYRTLSAAAYQRRLDELERETSRGVQVRRDAYQRGMAGQTAPYGTALAERVADGLKPGTSLAYSHRDYCGMGLERTAEGTYRYGPVYDGGMWSSDGAIQTFPDRAAFVAWLARQSDASLAMLDAPEDFYRGNQVLNRERLEAFIR